MRRLPPARADADFRPLRSARLAPIPAFFASSLVAAIASE